MTKEWSKYQLAVFDHVANKPRTHLIVDAKAGSGKTTTSVEMTRRVPRGQRVLMCAFNVTTRDALQARVDNSVTVRTFHQLGFYAVMKLWGKQEINKYRQRDLVRAVLPDKSKIGAGPFADITRMVSMAMARLAGTPAELEEIMDIYDCGPNLDEDRQQYIAWTAEVLRRTKEKTGEISFDDQVYLPAVFNVSGSRYDYVFVDEAQDCNPAQLRIVMNALRPGGKIVAVGDERQAIYAFRGAGQDTMSRLQRELNADVLPLSITYRCPRAVVRHVNPIVPDLEASPTADEGVVSERTEGEFLAGVRPGDLVLSRTNAAIATYSMKLLLQNKRCVVLGRDLSAGLISLVERGGAMDLKDMFAALDEYSAKECERLCATRKEDKAEELLDRIEALRGLSENLTTSYALRDRILYLFGDEDKTHNDAIIFSTVHKAKGLEYPRVWMFETTFNTKTVEGENLYYVAATRAMRELYLVQIPKNEKKIKKVNNG